MSRNIHLERLDALLGAKRPPRLPGEEGISGSDIVRVILLSVIFLFLATAILVLDIPLGERVTLEAGEVSPLDIRAPRSLRYESEVLTRQAREKAAQQVEEVYDAPRPQVARQQITRLQEIIRFIDTVRANPYADLEQKAREIQAITELNLSEEHARALAGMPQDRWELVAAETLATLRLAMGREIRESDLPIVRANVPLLVDQTRLTEQEAAIVTRIVQALLRPNTFPNPQKTERLRQEARESVPPVIVEYEAGEIIVRSGEVVTEAQVEALEKFGLRQRRITPQQIIGYGLFVALFVVMFLLYTYRRYLIFWQNAREPVLFYLLLLGGLALAKAMVPGHALLPYVYPLGALTVTIGILQQRELSLLATLFTAITLGHLAGNSLALTMYLSVGAVVMLLISEQAERLATYIWAGLALVGTQSALIFGFHTLNGTFTPNDFLLIFLATVVNGVLSVSLALTNFYLAGLVTDKVTIIQLLDLSRPTHPLMQELITKAPGTYHHSLVVSNLAERAAAAVGADAFLTRVGAYYHDVGKVKRPHYFTENVQGDINPHNQLDPHTSAQIIIGHVTDGLELARKYRLPRRIRDFIAEHHGTTLVAFFYRKALEQATDPEEVRERDFRYPGPKPRSKETAILMLADAVEAIARSRQPKDRQEIEAIVRQVIWERLEEGQLDEAPLTLRDLSRIRQALVEMLAGIYHTRVAYPEAAEPPAASEPSAATPSQSVPTSSPRPEKVP